MNIDKAGRLLVIAISGSLLLGASDLENALMNDIEQNVKLPQGASALADYVRKYTYMGDRTVIGVYVRKDMVSEDPGRSWVDRRRMPQISGGGCGVVTVFYDPRKKASLGTMCNFKE